MFGKIQYHKIVNFTTNGNLGISTQVIDDITVKAITEVKGASLPDSHSLLARYPVTCKFNPVGDLVIDAYICIGYGYNVSEVCALVQDKIEQSLMYMTEIKPKRIHLHVANINKSKNA